MTITNYPGLAPVTGFAADQVHRSLHDHALFTLPHVSINGKNIVTNEKVPVIIPIHGSLIAGVSGSFIIKPGNGVTAHLSVVSAEEMCNREWEDDRDLPLRINSTNSVFPGSSHNPAGWLIRPLIPWLEAGQRFHVFRIAFGSRHLAKDGGHPDTMNLPDLFFGIQRPD
jgi:hypothetical protein